MFTILLIEDDNALRGGLEFELATEGYNVIAAENGKKAIDNIQIADIVLMDVNLPDMEGFELCRVIKERRKIPVIFLTCFKEKDCRRSETVRAFGGRLFRRFSYI